jgi:DDE superfamily endonuclease
MDLYDRLEQIILELRPAFRREATFEWFVLLLWGALLATQPPAITSYVNALGLSESYYHQALHWFHSSAFSIDGLCHQWNQWLNTHPNTHQLKGQLVYVGDGIKVGKEGRKMPGVKGLHQESENVNKPEWLRGHYFSALGLLLGKGNALFATLIIAKLHDGIETAEIDSEGTLVDKMATLCIRFALEGSYVLLDSYYASDKVLKPFRESGLHLISRVRSTTVANAAFSRRPGKNGPGRHREWGQKVKLRELFAPLKDCHEACLFLYGKKTTVYYQCFEFYWDSPDELRLFVLTQFPDGKKVILLSSDIGLTGVEVIEAYSWRFKIEVSFRTLIYLLGGFSYKFWLKTMDKTSRWPDDLRLEEYPQKVQSLISAKVEAFERFVNLNAIGMSLLQILSLEMPESIWSQFPIWFRTLPQHGYPSEQVVRLSIQDQQEINLLRSRPRLLLSKLISEKTEQSQDLGCQALDDRS